MNDVFYLYYDDNEVLLCVTKILPYCIEETIYGTKPDSLDSCSKTPSYVLPAFLCKQDKQSATNFNSLKQEAQGATGAQGAAGTSGTSASSGSSATAGSSGAQGAQGATGPQIS